jgi:hypothetical protein
MLRAPRKRHTNATHSSSPRRKLAATTPHPYFQKNEEEVEKIGVDYRVFIAAHSRKEKAKKKAFKRKKDRSAKRP